MKQVYYRYFDRLNRKLLAVYLAGTLPSLLYDLSIGFQTLCGLGNVLLQLVPGWGKQLLCTGKDSLHSTEIEGIKSFQRCGDARTGANVVGRRT